MIIDTSALMAILRAEADANRYVDAVTLFSAVDSMTPLP